MEKLILIAAAILLLGSLSLFLYDRIYIKRTVTNLSKLLEQAMSGNLNDISYDESQYSFLEAKMAKFLAERLISANSIKYERDKIKELIADISHQTKTPIANILLYAQLIGEHQISSDCRQQVDLLIRQSEKLNFLIHSLVNLSRLETGIISVKPKKDSVNKLLHFVKENIEPKAEAKNITVLFPTNDDAAVFDIKWTTEALFNIADNAVKYTPVGGNLEFRITSYEMFSRIDISDTGIGIKKDELSKIFGRFYRSPHVTDENGVGIGLFIAREIISAEHGYIKVASKLGEGSTFSIFLPKSNI